MSTVSVVIPCYQYGHFLPEAVSSVLDDQEGVDVRVLIIDDASPDDSADVARQIAAGDSRVEVVVHDSNRGNIATYNEGLLEWAEGDSCLLLSADDRVTPGALSRAQALLDANPRVGFVYGRALWVTDGERSQARTTPRGWTVWSGGDWLERRFQDAENPISAPAIMVRTSLHQRVGGYDPQLPKAADMELFMRMSAYADVGFLRGVDQAFYRIHSSNMHNAVDAVMDLRQRRAVFETVLERYSHAIKDPERLSRTVHRQLGKEALWAGGRIYDRGPLRRSELGRKLLGAGQNEEQAVDEALAFAVECWPEVQRARLYKTLAARGRLGPLECASLLDSKARWWLRRRSWNYRGV